MADGIKQRILDDVKAVMRAREKERLGVLRTREALRFY